MGEFVKKLRNFKEFIGYLWIYIKTSINYYLDVYKKNIIKVGVLFLALIFLYSSIWTLFNEIFIVTIIFCFVVAVAIVQNQPAEKD